MEHGFRMLVGLACLMVLIIGAVWLFDRQSAANAQTAQAEDIRRARDDAFVAQYEKAGDTGYTGEIASGLKNSISAK